MVRPVRSLSMTLAKSTVRQRIALAFGVGLLAASALGTRSQIPRGVETSEIWIDRSDWQTHGRLYRPTASQGRLPGVLLVHGYAGNLVSMEAPFAYELARQGFVVLGIDYDGHGQSGGGTRRTRGAVGTPEEQKTLRLALDVLAEQPDVIPDRLALVGHSQGAQAATLVARLDARVWGVVSIAGPLETELYLDGAGPRNLLLIQGGRDLVNPARVPKIAKDIRWAVDLGRTYGDPTTGTGRRRFVALSAGHIAVLYDPSVRAEVLAWLRSTLSTGPSGSVVPHPIPRGWLVLGLVGLAISIPSLGSLLAWCLTPWAAQMSVDPKEAPESSEVRGTLVAFARSLSIVIGVYFAIPLVGRAASEFGNLPLSGASPAVGAMWATAATLLLSLPLLILPVKVGYWRNVASLEVRGIGGSLAFAAALVFFACSAVATISKHYYDFVPSVRRANAGVMLFALTCGPTFVWTLCVTCATRATPATHVTKAFLLAVLPVLSVALLLSNTSYLLRMGGNVLVLGFMTQFFIWPAVMLHCRAASIVGVTLFSSLLLAWAMSACFPFN